MNILHATAYCADCPKKKGVRGFATIIPTENLGLNHGILRGQLFNNCQTHHDNHRNPNRRGPSHNVFVLKEDNVFICNFVVSTEMVGAHVKVFHPFYQEELNREVRISQEGSNASGMRR